MRFVDDDPSEAAVLVGLVESCHEHLTLDHLDGHGRGFIRTSKSKSKSKSKSSPSPSPKMFLYFVVGAVRGEETGEQIFLAGWTNTPSEH